MLKVSESNPPEKILGCASGFLQDANKLKHEGRHAEAAPGAGGNPTFIVDKAPAQDSDRGAKGCSAADDDGARCCQGGQQVQDKGHGPGAAGQLQHRVLQACQLRSDEGTPPMENLVPPSKGDYLGYGKHASLRYGEVVAMAPSYVSWTVVEPHGVRETPADSAVWSSGGPGQTVPAQESQDDSSQCSKLQRSPRQPVPSSRTDSRRADECGGEVHTGRPHHGAGDGAPGLEGNAQDPGLGGQQGDQGQQGGREPPQATTTAGLADQAGSAEEHVSEAFEDLGPLVKCGLCPFKQLNSLVSVTSSPC